MTKILDLIIFGSCIGLILSGIGSNGMLIFDAIIIALVWLLIKA